MDEQLLHFLEAGNVREVEQRITLFGVDVNIQDHTEEASNLFTLPNNPRPKRL